jgi:Domain of unknown function (DUF4129)
VKAAERVRARLGLGRGLGLYLASLGAAVSAGLAWPLFERSSAAVAATTLALAGCLALAERLAPRVRWLDGRDAHRARSWLGTAYLAGAALGLVAAVGWPLQDLLRRETLAFAVLQGLLLLASQSDFLRLGALANALVLATLAGLSGGAPAAGAALLVLAGLSLELAHDHALAQTAAQTRLDADLPGRVLGDALGLAGPILTLLAVGFVLAPPTPHAGLRGDLGADLTRAQLASAYLQLAASAAIGAGIVYYATRLLRRRRSERSETLEVAEGEAEPDEILPERPTRRRVSYPGSRGAVVRAYLRALRAARAWGLKTRPHETPLEIAAALRGAPPEWHRLTATFMDARYGANEPSEAVVRRAEADLAAIDAALKARGARRSA